MDKPLLRAQADTVWFDYQEDEDLREGYKRYILTLPNGKWSLLQCADGTSCIRPITFMEFWSSSDIASFDGLLTPIFAAKIILRVESAFRRGFSCGERHRTRMIKRALEGRDD